MSVTRPSTPTIIPLDLKPLRALLRAHAPGNLVSAVMYTGCLGAVGVFEVWARTQPQEVSAEAIRLLGRGYGQIGLALLLGCMIARPLSRIWTLPMRLRRELGVLGFTFSMLHTLNTLPHAPLSLEAMQNLPLEAQVGTLLGVAAFLGLVPLALTSNTFSIYRLGNAWVTLQRMAGSVVLLAVLHTLTVGGTFQLNARNPSLLGFGLLVVTALIYLARLRKPATVPERDSGRISGRAPSDRDSSDRGSSDRAVQSAWDSNAVHGPSRDSQKDTQQATPKAPTQINPEPITIGADPSAQGVQVMQRLRFDRASFKPASDDGDWDDDPDHDSSDEPTSPRRPGRSTLEQSLIEQLGLLDQLEQYAPDAVKLSVLYRRTEDERVLRCSMAVNFDPKADGWTALEIANAFLSIVRQVASERLGLHRLEIRVYQEGFRHGASQRLERTFNFDLQQLRNTEARGQNEP